MGIVDAKRFTAAAKPAAYVTASVVPSALATATEPAVAESAAAVTAAPPRRRRTLQGFDGSQGLFSSACRTSSSTTTTEPRSVSPPV